MLPQNNTEEAIKFTGVIIKNSVYAMLIRLVLSKMKENLCLG
jgi:hypothetical protein